MKITLSPALDAPRLDSPASKALREWLLSAPCWRDSTFLQA